MLTPSAQFLKMIVPATEIHKSLPMFRFTFVMLLQALATITIARTREMGCLAPGLSSTQTGVAQGSSKGIYGMRRGEAIGKIRLSPQTVSGAIDLVNTGSHTVY